MPMDDLRTRKERGSATRGLLSLSLLLIALPGVVQSQEPPASQNPYEDRYTIKVNVDSVVLHPAVQDTKGVLVSGLGKNDFQVYEDGVLQQIKYFGHEDIPATVGLIVDNSGSMAGKRSEVIVASVAFARSSNPEDQMFVIIFNEGVYFGLPDGTPFTDNAESLENALSRIASDGMTALYDAVAAGLEHLKKGDRDKKVLIVISDGSDNASKSKLPEIMTMAGQSNAIVYTTGLFDLNDPDRNPRVLRQLARATGGEAFFPSHVGEIIPILEQIAHDIRNQYTIVYSPTNQKQDGTYRTLRVKAAAPGRGRLSVRTRAGYYAPGNSEPVPGSKP